MPRSDRTGDRTDDGSVDRTDDLVEARTTLDDTTASTDDASAGADGPAARTDEPPAGKRRRRIDRATLAVSFAIATGLVLIVVGFSISITGDARIEYPAEIERVDPVPNSVSVLAQTSVFVDLQQGYTGVLVINGVEIPTFRIGEVEVDPGRQVDIPPVTVFEPGNATLTFRPSPGALVERFENGMQLVEVIYWREDEGRQRAESFVWEFNVL